MRRFFAAAAVFALALSMVVPANANVITRTDGNDTPGPLDLSAISVAHRDGRQVFTFTTFDTIYPADVNGDNGWFEVDLDVNGDKDWNYYAAIFWFDGKLRGVYGRAGGGVIDTLPVGKPAANKVWISVPARAPSYDFAAFSVHMDTPCTESKPCVDAIPNDYPLIRHDLTAPTVNFVGSVDVSTDRTAGLTLPVGFRITDDPNGSGVGHWVLEKRAVGTSRWIEEARGTSSEPTVKVDLTEGKTYDLRVTAWDKQGNSSSKTSRVSVPTDDSRAMFDYTGAWTSVTDQAGAFLRTVHQGAQGTEVRVTFAGTPSRVCVLAGPTSGPRASAEMYLDGGWVARLREDGSDEPRKSVGCSRVRNMGKTVSLKIVPTTSEPFVFDGIVIKL